MIKSIKGQFVLSLCTAIGFIYFNFSHIDFVGNNESVFTRVLFFFIMILSVFNAGILTQKYVQTRNKKKN